MKTRLAEGRPNSWNTKDCCITTVSASLQIVGDALRVWSAQGFDATVPIEGIDDVVRAYNALDALTRYLPQVEAWCVVHREGKGSLFHGDEPKVRVGLRTPRRAAAFCAAIDEHYTAEAKRNKWPVDTWTVEKRACSIRDMLSDSLTPAEYIKTIAR